MKLEEIKKIALRARENFVTQKIDMKQLSDLYFQYNPIKDMDLFLVRAVRLFPQLNCGLASVYLRNELQQGKIVQGSYDDKAHTFLLLEGKVIVDITADQYGGSPVYVGSILQPWKT